MRLLNYLKEDWTIKSSTAIYQVYDNRWGDDANGNDIILYVYDRKNKALYWKKESGGEIIKNKHERTIKSKTEDHHGMLFALGVSDMDVDWGITFAHGIILKNKIYPYENEESKLSQEAFFAIKRCLKSSWWVR
jgi:hypothetical protein